MKWTPKIAPLTQISDEEADALRVNIPTFAPMFCQEFERFVQIPERRTITAGTELLSQGETAQSVLLVREGLLKLVHTSVDGTLTVLGLRSAGWYAAAASVITGTSSTYSITTITQCLVSPIKAEIFEMTLLQHSSLLHHFLRITAQELIAQTSSQTHLMASSAEYRLHLFLREQHIPDAKWPTLNTLPFLRQMDIAGLLSISPEYLSRLLQKLSRKGLSSRLHGEQV